ncbi:MAG: bis(5'-nucleosyl)-tetraphosphatase (symmetrical) YqeK [Rubrobacter sp.]|jgi:predicted HD superfamily hydrolase involved in NAD metabolism|nr:bis(5'-nucleosyl)-tetraphosphatase (symmetrical) YqeK [Rubrobacter sp.]
MRVPDLLEAADGLAHSRLSEKRYGHTLRVAETAVSLAEAHGTDPHRARLAGLLHDAAREMSQQDLLRTAERWHLPVDDFERDRPVLLHGPVAAGLARRELGVEEEAVLGAVRAHTTGEPGMDDLSLLLYVADKIEPGRDYPGIEGLRELAHRDLHAATARILRSTRDHNRNRGRPTHPRSRKALEWLEGTT